LSSEKILNFLCNYTIYRLQRENKLNVSRGLTVTRGQPFKGRLMAAHNEEKIAHVQEVIQENYRQTIDGVAEIVT
jgi:hypothetical protein